LRRILEGLTVALVGGDEREVILAQALLNEGAKVLLVGYLPRPELAGAEHWERRAALTAADAVVAPITNTDEKGKIKAFFDPAAEIILDTDAFKAMQGKPLFIGVAKQVVQDLAAKFRVPVYQTAEIDEIAVLNSIPTAEGAIARAMNELPITLHGSRSVVVGFGRCGITLARMLLGIGARVYVAARSAAQRARAYEMGISAHELEELPAVVAAADVVFNTVPSLVLTAEVLQAMPVTCLIVDIASAPGGTDFAYAKKRGIKAFLDLGIPGKVAPRTAGEILARTLPPMIADACRRSK
jgi:dipicolinate synthase subunit A